LKYYKYNFGLYNTIYRVHSNKCEGLFKICEWWDRTHKKWRPSARFWCDADILNCFEITKKEVFLEIL
jgi:hypothetical protein